MTMMAGLPKILGGVKVTSLVKKMDELDEEWVQLILEALEMGIDKEDIRAFLSKRDVLV